MTNDFFNHDAPLTDHTLGRAGQVNNIFDAVASGFEKLPSEDALNQARATYYEDSGAVNVYVVTMSPALSSYTAGLNLKVKFANANTGASTLNVNAVGAKTIKRFDGTTLSSGDIVANSIVDLIYDGTDFRIVGAHGNFASSLSSTISNHFQKMFNPINYGAVGDGATDCTTAFQDAIDAGVATNKPFTLYIPAGDYKISDELDLTAVDQGDYIHIRGDGIDVSYVEPTSFGRTKKLFKFGGTHSSKLGGPHLEAFTIEGNNDEDDPISVHCPGASNCRWNFKVQGVDNIGIFIEEADNSRFEVEVSGCGYQHLEYRQATAVYAGTSGTTLTAYSDTSGTTIPGYFTGRVGEIVYVDGGDDAVSADDIWAKREIATVPGDGSSCTVDFAFDNTLTYSDGRKMSYGPLLGSITSGNNTLTISNDVMSASDIGRPIFIRGAGRSAGVLHSEITNVSGTTITIADNASTTVSGEEVYVAPAMVISIPEDDYTSSDATNDITIRGRIESHDGPGLLICDAQNVRISDLKFHGHQLTSNNFARSRASMIVSRSDIIADGTCVYEKSYVGGHPTDSYNDATVQLYGDRITCSIGGFFRPYPNYQYSVSFDATDTDSIMNWGPAQVAGSVDRPFVRLGSSLKWNSIQFSGGVTPLTGPGNTESAAGGILNAQSIYSMRKTVSNNNFFIFDPKLESGKIYLWCPNLQGGNLEYVYEGWIRTGYHGSGSHVRTAVDAGAKADCSTYGSASDTIAYTDGTSTNLTMRLCSDGKIAVINRTGASKTVTMSMGWGF